jgi:hypothetical protein
VIHRHTAGLFEVAVLQIFHDPKIAVGIITFHLVGSGGCADQKGMFHNLASCVLFSSHYAKNTFQKQSPNQNRTKNNKHWARKCYGNKRTGRRHKPPPLLYRG